MQRFLNEFLNTTALLAPFLLLGFLIAGLLHAFVPRSLLARAMGGSGLGPITRASLMGIPLPLCSCSVMPVATELRRQGAGRGATTAFMLSTTDTGVDSVSSVVPPRIQQQRVLDWLAEERQGRLAPERVRASFARSAVEAGLRVEPFESGLDLFVEAVSVTAPIDVEELQRSAQSRHLLERYLRQVEGGWQSVVYLYPPPRIWRREPPPQAVKLAEELGPKVTLTGGNVVSSRLRATILEDAGQGVALGFALVGLILFIDYRRLSDTLMTLAPLVMGMVWMLGIMALMGLAMNFMNIFVTTMIIGIGVDYGVHAIHRYRENQRRAEGDLETDLVQTGRAIAMAALSTIAGFGSLSLSSYPGLRSMGLVAILGALTTCLVALTVLPAFLRLRADAGSKG